MRARPSIVTLCLALFAATTQAQQGLPNPTGTSASVNLSGPTDLDGAFFQSFGTNGRTCATCHLPEDGWSLSARSAQRLFEETDGLHPLFAFDGQNCSGQDLSTVEARRSASSLMLERAVVRFDKVIPDDAEFELVAAQGTYCNAVGGSSLVVFRRSLPTTNFETLSVATWDGFGNAIFVPLSEAFPGDAVFGTLSHAQAAAPPPPEAIEAIVELMLSLRTAQVWDDDAQNLDAKHGHGGPAQLAALPTDAPAGFDLFDAWIGAPGRGVNGARGAVARGQELFNARCAGCHDSPNRGNSSSVKLIDLGLTGPARSPADLPMYKLRNRATGELRQSSDPGNALVSGRWADIGKFKVPNLRALASHAPYFHNGFAATLEEVVAFYDARFSMGLSETDRADLVRFLRAL